MEHTLTHLIRADEWRAALHVGHVAVCPDGFVHLSTTEQVAATAGRFYRGCNDLHILAVDDDRTGAELKWEEGEPGQLFPHVYGPLPLSSVRAIEPCPVDADGACSVPALPPVAATGVRKITPSDADAYVALAAEAHGERSGAMLSDEQRATVATLWDDGTVGGLVYERAGELVAGLVWTAARLDRRRGRAAAHTALVAEVATAPTAWSGGLASILLHRTVVDLAPLGYDTVELWTQADNLRARRLYEHLGWARTSSLPGIGRDGSTLVQYQRSL